MPVSPEEVSMRQEQETQPPLKNSSRRKAQNIIAQRKYRIRQKERMKELERLAATAVVSKRLLCSSGTSLNYDSDRDDVNNFQLGLAAENLKHVDQSSPHGLTNAFISSCFHSLPTNEQRDTLIKVLKSERFGLQDIVKYGIISLGFAIDPALHDSSKYLSLANWTERIVSCTGGVDLRTLVSAGIQLIGGLKVPVEMQDGVILNYSAHFIPVLNYIQISQWSYIAAIAANAEHLGLLYEVFFDDDAQSPFLGLSKRNPETKESNESGSDTASSSGTSLMVDTIKHDLKPTAVQETTPHHPCYDVMPWPVFRSKVVMAISADPPLINEEDLCMDILNGGIFCWGSTGQSMHGRGGGVPWDSRSWEAAPWFLQKWTALTDGRNGEMWRTSEWWRSMRR